MSLKSINHVLDKTDYGKFSHYLGNAKVKRAGVKTLWTQELLDEYMKCKDDILYFAEKYFYVISLDKGLHLVELWGFQKEILLMFQQNRFNIVLAPRQVGKSLLYTIFLTHFAIFNEDQNIAILANKGSLARDILSKISLAIENLPFFLQPGCKTFNKGNIEFDTNTNIFAASTTSSSARGTSLNILVLDEFSFVKNDVEFMNSVYPTISSGKNSKVIIVSTANGVNNQYYKLWQGALQGTNDFKHYKVHWSQVPGRDEAWKESFIKNTSQKQFDQEMGCDFLGTSNTLIDSKILIDMFTKKPIFENSEIRIFEEPQENQSYIMTVDVSKGLGKDFSTFTIFKVIKDFLTKIDYDKDGNEIVEKIPYVSKFEQVCVYQNSIISTLILPEKIYHYATKYNNAYVIIERNDQGQQVAQDLYMDLEYENMFNESTLKNSSMGVFVDKKVKAIGCANLKELIENGKLLIYDKETIAELSAFEQKKNSYEGKNKHDDLVSNLWLFAWFTKNPVFKELEDTHFNLREFLYHEKQLKDNSEPFIGFYDDGINTNKKDDLLRQGFLPLAFRDSDF